MAGAHKCKNVIAMSEKSQILHPLDITHTRPSMALVMSAGEEAPLNQVPEIKWTVAVHLRFSLTTKRRRRRVGGSKTFGKVGAAGVIICNSD